MKTNKEFENVIVRKVFNYYRESVDCNGLDSHNLNLSCSEEESVRIICNLIDEDKLEIIAFEHDENPHINRFGFPSKEMQISYLQKNGMDGRFCIYPSNTYLQRNMETDFIPKYPFQYMIQFGNPQLKECYFEWGVLYKYFSDPRYRFDFSDYIGQIGSTDSIDDNSFIDLKTFGIGKDANGNRVVVSYPRYLRRMSSACQIEWYSKLIPDQEGCKVLRSYADNLFNGSWSFPQTVYKSIIQEISNINQLTSKIWNYNFFRIEFDKDKPVGFDMIYIPTYKVYMDYVLLLEKMVVSNIDDKFFDVIKWPRCDDKGRKKGTLHCLKEFLQKVNPGVEDDITASLRAVRAYRQAPAHKIEEDSYDIMYFNKQHDITVQVFNSLNLLRKLMQTHPKVENLGIRYKQTENYIIP